MAMINILSRNHILSTANYRRAIDASMFIYHFRALMPLIMSSAARLFFVRIFASLRPMEAYFDDGKSFVASRRAAQ